MTTPAPPADSPPSRGRERSRRKRIVIAVVALAFIGSAFWYGSVRVAAVMERSRANVRLSLIGLAHIYYTSQNKGHFPGDITDADGRPLLSWRVRILPNLDCEELYREFHLDEPWDSEHNRKLIPRMPLVYTPISREVQPGETLFCRFVGLGAAFEHGKKIPDTTFRDGLSNTVLVTEAADPVVWTKPQDLAFDPNGPLPAIGGEFDRLVPALFADGSVMYLNRDADPVHLKAAITRSSSDQPHDAIVSP